MFNRILSVMAGCMVGILVIFAGEAVTHAVYPLPEGIDPSNPEQLKKVVELMPTGAFIGVLLSAFTGGFVAALVASRISKARHLRHSLIAGLILTLLGLVNVILIPHPVWFVVCSLLVYLAGAYAGNRLYMLLKK